MCFIWVVDGAGSRRERIVLALQSLLNHAHLLGPDDVRAGAISEPDAPAIALVGFSSASDSAEFDVVRTLCHQGCEVLAYADEWSEAPLDVRCKALMAGVGDVLDSARATFVAELRSRLTRVIATSRRRDEDHQRLSATMARLGIVGRSVPMLSLGRWILKVGPLSDLPVLVTGETGTGKELVARAIHQVDPKRCAGPFVPLNCAALTPSLAESELFGHRKGAFTGALQDRRGLIRSANGGTLFLDEIGDLETALQGKLLRVLQEGTVRGVGDDREEPVSIRVVAATNRDLSVLVDQGRFRIDLFYRLNLLLTRTPTLAERGDDLNLLVAYFIRKYGAARTLHAAPSLLAALKALTLPGNVRQLENLICHAVVNARDDGTLGVEELPESVWDQLSRKTSDGAGDPGGHDWAAVLDTNAWNLSRSLLTCERQFLKAALVRAHGNQSATARLLGVTPRSIYNKIRKHRLAG